MKKINYLGEVFFFVCLLGILYLWYVIYKPFLGIFLISAAITSIFYPAYLGIMQKSKRIGPSLASLLMVLAISFIVIIPLILFLLYLSTQVGSFYDWLMKIFDSGFLTVWVDKFNLFISRFFSFSLNEETVITYFTNIGSGLNQWLISATSSIINNAFQMVTSFLFLIVCLFFMFRDGKKILVRIMQWTPLHDRYDLEIYKKFQEVSYAAFLATFVTAVAQAVVASVAYAIVGLPVLFLGLATAVASIIPLFGTVLVWGPIALYFMFIGAWGKAIFLVLWGSIVIGLVDNVLRPWVMKGHTNIHPFILFFGILGGIVTFGFWGIIYGPLIIAIGLTFLHIYSLEYSQFIFSNRFLMSQQEKITLEALQEKVGKVERKTGRKKINKA
ncbi:MAG TPA: AI-2E family transporter [bacterium]|nr:AI-2E family transporter [bacterium]